MERLHLIVHPFLMRILNITGLSDIATVQPADGLPRDDGNAFQPS
jgi:hypothetical protein